MRKKCQSLVLFFFDTLVPKTCTMDLSPQTPLYSVSSSNVLKSLVPEGWTGNLLWLNPVSALQSISSFAASIEVLETGATVPFTEGKRDGGGRPQIQKASGPVRYTYNVAGTTVLPSGACGAPNVYLLASSPPSTTSVAVVQVGSQIAQQATYKLLSKAVTIVQTPASEGVMLSSNLQTVKRAWSQWRCPAFKEWLVQAALRDGLTSYKEYASLLAFLAPKIPRDAPNDLKAKIQDQLAWVNRLRSKVPDTAFFLAARTATRAALQALLNCRNAQRKGDASLQQKCYETGAAALKVNEKYLADWPQKAALQAMATEVENPVPTGTAIRAAEKPAPAKTEGTQEKDTQGKKEEEEEKGCCINAPYKGCNDKTKRLFAFIDGMEKLERLRRYGSAHDRAMRRYERQLEDDDIILDAARCRLLERAKADRTRRRRRRVGGMKKGKRR